MSTLSARVRAIAPSATMALATRAREMRAQGRDVVSLTAGEPDFPTPPEIVEAAHEAMLAGRTHYTGAGGLPELNKAIQADLTRGGVVLDSPTQVLPTPGAKQAIYYAIQALVEPGDGVVVLEPAWVSYVQIIGLAGGEVRPVRLDPADDFTITKELLEPACRGAKVMLVNSPNNPTGRVLTEAEIEAIVAVAVEHDLTIVSDEIYGRLVYAPSEFRRLASHPDLAPRTLTVDGFSKSWAMTGWRLGYVAGPTELVAGMRKLQSHSATCPAEFTQVAGVTALEACDEHVERFRRSFEARGKLVLEEFSSIPGVRVPAVQGAFYAFLDCREIMGGDDVALCERWLDGCEVAMVPGSAFGEAGKGFLRMSFASSEEDLKRAAARLREAAIE